MAYPFSLTLRFHLTENVCGMSSGEPYTAKNESFFEGVGRGGEGQCMHLPSRG